SVPPQYKTLYERLKTKVASVPEFEAVVLTPLVDSHALTSAQACQIVDCMYDHDLLPPRAENNFYQILGLVALELESPGAGEYAALQFRLSAGLPPLPEQYFQYLSDPVDRALDRLEERLGAQVPPLASLLDSGSGVVSEWPSAPTGDPLMGDPLMGDPDVSVGEIAGAKDENSVRKYVAQLRDGFVPLVGANDRIAIREVPEKEGLLFKHINYAITHELRLGTDVPAGPRKVIRRYSDFVWLLEFLLKKYTLRVIPGLPPKKFSVGASPDSQFLQRRRRGLHRFLNQLIKHPVFVKEPIVATFLTVPTDLASWRRQAKIDDALEFTGQKILITFINTMWPAVGEEFLQNWRAAEEKVPRMIEVWSRIVVLVERHEKRQKQVAHDNSRFFELLLHFTQHSDAVYPCEKPETRVLSALNHEDAQAIGESLASVSAFFGKMAGVLVDESFVFNTTVLEKFKNYLDYLQSLQELFARAKRLLVNTIAQLQLRIQESERRYEQLAQNDTDIKGAELMRLRQAIVNDKQEMFKQLNKNWLIKQCCMEEFVMFQETQFLVAEAWADWCRGRSQYLQKYYELCDGVSEKVASEMPL
ncbi:PX-domain-containing protein, partial [Metschnikowia bicuspidata]